MAYVACGRVDAFFEAILQPWDFAAAKLLIEGAGERWLILAEMIFPQGEPAEILAGNGKINEELLEIIRKDGDNW